MVAAREQLSKNKASSSDVDCLIDDRSDRSHHVIVFSLAAAFFSVSIRRRYLSLPGMETAKQGVHLSTPNLSMMSYLNQHGAHWEYYAFI